MLPVLTLMMLLAAGDPTKGKELFRSCSGCHNTETEDRKMAPSLRSLFGKVTLRNGKRVDTENVRTIIQEGYNGMPSFQYSFRPQEMDDLVAYLQTLRGRPLAKEGTVGAELFRAHCIQCHDPAVRTSVGPDLRGRFKPEWLPLVDEGHGGAPPLKDWLDETGRRALADHLKGY
jgi:mono/diheme cytochrome c family protein